MEIEIVPFVIPGKLKCEVGSSYRLTVVNMVNLDTKQVCCILSCLQCSSGYN